MANTINPLEPREPYDWTEKDRTSFDPEAVLGKYFFRKRFAQEGDLIKAVLQKKEEFRKAYKRFTESELIRYIETYPEIFAGKINPKKLAKKIANKLAERLYKES